MFAADATKEFYPEPQRLPHGLRQHIADQVSNALRCTAATAQALVALVDGPWRMCAAARTTLAELLGVSERTLRRKLAVLAAKVPELHIWTRRGHNGGTMILARLRDGETLAEAIELRQAWHEEGRISLPPRVARFLQRQFEAAARQEQAAQSGHGWPEEPLTEEEIIEIDPGMQAAIDALEAEEDGQAEAAEEGACKEGAGPEAVAPPPARQTPRAEDQLGEPVGAEQPADCDAGGTTERAPSPRAEAAPGGAGGDRSRAGAHPRPCPGRGPPLGQGGAGRAPGAQAGEEPGDVQGARRRAWQRVGAQVDELCASLRRMNLTLFRGPT